MKVVATKQRITLLAILLVGACGGSTSDSAPRTELVIQDIAVVRIEDADSFSVEPGTYDARDKWETLDYSSEWSSPNGIDLPLSWSAPPEFLGFMHPLYGTGSYSIQVWSNDVSVECTLEFDDAGGVTGGTILRPGLRIQPANDEATSVPPGQVLCFTEQNGHALVIDHLVWDSGFGY